MAKVKDQLYDGSEISYIDASGRTHYLGEFLRQTMTNGYPLPSLNPTSVSRKSPRGNKPTTRGRGSEEQAPWRDCYQQCCDNWNAMQDDCPSIGPCITVTSKKKIWEAKQEQGVMCSYFDLYMGCCLSFCTEIEVTGSDGGVHKGGAIPANDGCWPCESPCMESILSIGCTTNHMQVGQSQDLWAVDSFFGTSIPCYPPDEIHWSIASGGGSLSNFTGLSTTYTAPDKNDYCLDNVLIEIVDPCERSAELGITINAYVAYELAYIVIDYVTCSIPGSCHYMGSKFYCWGEWTGEHDGDWCCVPGSACPCTLVSHCEGACLSPIDKRSPAMIAQGCCPPL